MLAFKLDRSFAALQELLHEDGTMPAPFCIVLDADSCNLDNGGTEVLVPAFVFVRPACEALVQHLAMEHPAVVPWTFERNLPSDEEGYSAPPREALKVKCAVRFISWVCEILCALGQRCQTRHIWLRRNVNLSTFQHDAMLKVLVCPNICQRFSAMPRFHHVEMSFSTHKVICQIAIRQY